MADNSWRDLDDNWERVKWARSQLYESAAVAAEAIGMQAGTYRCYERGPDASKFIELSYKQARAFAREFKVRWEWLLDGEGEPWLTPPEEVETEHFNDLEEPAPNNLQAWREHSGLTVEKLSRKSGVSAQTIKALEAGTMDLSDKLLRKLAPSFRTTAGHILDFEPGKPDPEVLKTFNAIPPERREQALEILKTFRETSKGRPSNDT
jgi:transcriptional regulator with XRE-family HTH domain